jgi:molybdenum cofactor cytidylyltransferase
MKTVAIVLAAGKSRRMGVNKLLLTLGGKTVLGHILDNLDGYDTIVVTGHNQEEINGLINEYGVKSVHNPDYEMGMTTSFQAGLRELDNDVDAVFMILSDTFGFKPSLLDRMVGKMESTDASLVSPMYDGKRGHPVLVSRSLLQEFLSLSHDETMKDVVLRHEEDHQYVEGSIWTRLDLDTPQDYASAKKLWDKR